MVWGVISHLFRLSALCKKITLHNLPQAESEDCKIACKEHVINVDFKMPLNLIVHRSWLKQRVGTFLKFKNFISATSICLFVQKGEVGWHKIAHKYLEYSLKISPGSVSMDNFKFCMILWRA